MIFAGSPKDLRNFSPSSAGSAISNPPEVCASAIINLSTSLKASLKETTAFT